jgi:hypothetical protein
VLPDEKFWKMVNRFGPRQPHMKTRCWLWTGSVRPNGYGQVRRRKKCLKAHRYSYELVIGPIPNGLHVDHRCRFRPCVRPSHLEPVTQLENNFRSRKEVCKKGHPRAVVGTYKRSDRRNECAECNRIRDRKRYVVRRPRIREYAA